jgi:undecaprenyl-diphosphatase
LNETLAWWHALALGVLQGLTEFLPVSSSAHLALAQAWLDAPVGDGFVAMLHAGMLLPIALVFPSSLRELAQGLVELPKSLRRPLADWNARTLLAGKVVLGTIPGAAVGLLLRESVGPIASTDKIALYLIVGALVLAATRWAPPGEGAVTWRSAILIGWAQACAILPGISRSGATIAVALLLGVGRARAAEFSFLLAVPLVLGSTILGLPALLAEAGTATGSRALGLAASVLAGRLALGWLLRAVRRGRLHWFAGWCVAVALVAAIAPRL